MSSCCDPLGNHKKPYLCTKKTKSNFRTITEALRAKSTKLLPISGLICHSCRLAVSRNEVQEARPVELPSCSISTQKCITCSNVLGIHLTVRRKSPEENWYRMDGPLYDKAQTLQLLNPLHRNDRVCFECRNEIIRRHTILFSPGKYCCDPFQQHTSPFKKKFLTVFRQVTAKHIALASSCGKLIGLEDSLCMGCEKQLCSHGMEIQENEEPEEAMDITEATEFDSSDSSSESVSISDDDTEYIDRYVAEERFKELCKILQMETPTPNVLKSKKNCMEVLDKITYECRNLLSSFTGVENKQCFERGCSVCRCLVNALVEKYSKAENITERYQCLTSTPKWVSLNIFETDFGVSRRTAVKASRLRNTDGPLSFPCAKIGKKLESSVVELIQAFYRSDDNSRFSPAARDTIYLRERVNGVIMKRLVQKKEMMGTLKQMYLEFQNKYPEISVSCSKFASLRPKECVWGFRKGFQKTCLCLHHTNFGLLCDGLRIKTNTTETLLKFYCQLDPVCIGAQCSSCPNWQYIEDILESWEADNVEYWQWTNASNQCIELTKLSENKDIVQANIKVIIPKLAEHHLVYIKQRDYINDLKEFTFHGEDVGILNVDFSQNYSFTVPNAVQSFHWSTSQATLHPFCLYSKSPRSNNVELYTFAVVSDHMTHDATSFHVFRNFVLEKMKAKYPWIKKLVYVSDGAGGQYKNVKNFANLFYHKKDFGLQATLVFSATAHGKAIVDAVAAIIKRDVRGESLRRQDNFILTPYDMYTYLHSKNGINNMEYIFVTTQMVKDYEIRNCLSKRYERFSTIPGTRQYHHVEVDGKNLLLKTCSTANDIVVHPFDKKGQSKSDMPRVGQYASCLQSEINFIGLVDQACSVTGEIVLHIMKPVGKLFEYTNPPLLKQFASTDLILILSPPSAVVDNISSLRTKSNRQKRFAMNVRLREKNDLPLNCL